MKEKIVRFLQDFVFGKELHTDEVIYSLENGTLEGSYADSMFFSDLITTTSGIQFNMTTITREKIYKLDEQKNRIEIRKDFTGTSVFRYEIAFRKSTQEMTGYVRILSSTVPDHTMEAVIYGVYDVCLQDNQLQWKEQQLLYRDMPADNDSFRPVAFDANVRFYLENEKIRFEYAPTFYDVSTETFERKLAPQQYPSFISKEK